MDTKNYNKTQLSPDKTFERHVFHRDQFAHYLRWTHILKIAKIGMNILDFGCGSGNLAKVLYRNRFKAKKYLGLDIRKRTINKNIEKFKNVKWINFNCVDLCKKINIIKNKWNIICSFEVIEHIGKNNVNTFLKNIGSLMDKQTVFLLSTPIYDKKVGAANNHIINGEICEFTFKEMKKHLEKYFLIKNVWGTFASQKDYKPIMNKVQKEFYNQVYNYFDSNILSNLMAPLFPEHSRNCLWSCKLK